MHDTDYMQIALEEARLAYAEQEVPIGAVVVDEVGEVIARAHNLRETDKSPIAHAEILAIEQVARKKDAWRLTGCTVYVTLEPCIMCAGAMHQARISRCVFGAYDKKCGALKTLYEVAEDKRLNHNFEVFGGILEDECASILQDFFKKRR